jgi:predicted membrane protein
MPEEKKEKKSLFFRIVSSNLYAYLSFVIALLVCFYTIYNVEDYQQKIKNEWIKYLNSECTCNGELNINTVEFELMTPGEIIKDFGKDKYNETPYFINDEVDKWN